MISTEKYEFIRIWRQRWLELIFEFAHLEFQKNLWLDQKYTNLIGWFDEDVCKYFDDLNLDDHYQDQLNEQIISHEEYSAIKEFHFAFDHYLMEEKQSGVECTDNTRLQQREWKNIVDQGYKSWQMLKQVILNKEELAYMDELEKNI